MAVSAAQFRADFPEFADAMRFPNSVVDFWLANAPRVINAQRWGTSFALGVSLFTAHNITIERRAMDEANRGAIPGGQTGAISSKSVDKVSVNYDVSSTVDPEASHWNLTVYGTRYAAFARLFGAGGVQVGIGCGTGISPGSLAWAGPWQSMFPNPSD